VGRAVGGSIGWAGGAPLAAVNQVRPRGRRDAGIVGNRCGRSECLTGKGGRPRQALGV